ncbi:Sodium/hydrogen exchanger family-domain-containing protein [Spinellus fusiger]|nr:Sodium/hydrogen exchanger family-domain-containing protein [Spinellus fusiger]
MKLKEYNAFETLVFGMIDIYGRTVDPQNKQAQYDFKTPALKLAYDFEHAIKASHLDTQKEDIHEEDPLETSENASNKDKDINNKESMNHLLDNMLQEVRETADHVEEGIHQNSPGLDTINDPGSIETVRIMKDGQGDEEDSRTTLIDQDNNEYILTRSFDTTVIHEDIQLLHDLILIIILSFVLGWLFSAAGGALTILLVTVLVFIGLGAALETTWKEAVFMGACVSLSSTAVVVKCIRLDHLDHLYGLLVMQDVLLGFMLAVLPALAKPGIQIAIAILRTALSFVIFGAVCFAILRILPLVTYAFHHVFPHRSMPYSHELSMLGAIALSMAMLLMSESLGLGIEIGCFAAGVMIRTRRNLFEASIHLVEPIRDFFACLFFASIGLHIYPTFLASEAMLLLLLAAGVVGFKYVVTLIVLIAFKLDIHKASVMALALAQISEFGFVLASRAKQLDIITREAYYLLLGVTAITLIATPLLWKVSEKTCLHLPHGAGEKNHKESESHVHSIIAFDESGKIA